jgi:hypothetical protein
MSGPSPTRSAPPASTARRGRKSPCWAVQRAPYKIQKPHTKCTFIGKR